MEFKHRGYNQHYHTPSSSSPSTNPCFSDHSVNEGFCVGGGQGGVEFTRGSVVTREAVQRELEKEKIREDIVAEEIARRRDLEAEVRRELVIEREMMRMQIRGGIPSSFTAADGRIAAAYGGGRQIGGFEVDPYQRLPQSLEDSKNKVIDLGKRNGATISGVKPKPKPPPSAAYVTKKETVEWSCAVCKFTTTCEPNFNQHLAGKKHQTNVTTLRGYKSGVKIGLGSKPATKESPQTQPPLNKTSNDPCSTKKTEVWRCPVCKISAPCERALTEHFAGKKHQTNVTTLCDDKPGANIVLDEKPATEKSPKTQPPLNKTSNEHCSTKKTEVWRCPVCKINAPCERALTEHFAGKKHQTNVTSLHGYKSGAKIVPNEKPATKRSPETQPPSNKTLNEPCSTEVWSCAVCEITTTSERGLVEHLVGKKHQAKVLALTENYTGTNVVPPPGGTIGSSGAHDTSVVPPGHSALGSQMVYSQNTRGELDCSAPNKPTTTTQPSSIKNSSKCVSTSSGLCSSKKKGEGWTCAVCEVSVKSEHDLNKHLAGKKHQTNVEAMNALVEDQGFST